MFQLVNYRMKSTPTSPYPTKGYPFNPFPWDPPLVRHSLAFPAHHVRTPHVRLDRLLDVRAFPKNLEEMRKCFGLKKNMSNRDEQITHVFFQHFSKGPFPKCK